MTAHEQGARDVLHRWLQDPERALFAANSLSEIAGGRFNDTELAAVMGSGHWASRGAAGLAPEQMLMLMFTHLDVCAGRIARTWVRTAGEPSSDRYRDENAAAVADLPHPFTAYVDPRQNGADSDGWLEWSEPIEVSVCTEETVISASGRPENVQALTMVGPGGVPLEIGSTSPSRTRLHIVQNLGVARWPYEHDKIYVWVTPDRLGSVTPLPSPDELRVGQASLF